MSDWQPSLYLRFGRERTQPSIDLVARIGVGDPRRILDVGCGPGNSTAVLKARWPQAHIIGLDSSAAMIADAQTTYPDLEWIRADASGDLTGLGRFDVVFSNAAIQWIPDQEALLPKLFAMLEDGGVLAVQVPDTGRMPLHLELVRLASSEAWSARFEGMASSYSVHGAGFYYATLCGLSSRLDLWETRYFHVMDDHAAIVSWYSGSGLRPYLDCLSDHESRRDFLAQYEAALVDAYPVQPDGRVLLPFTRVFFMATH